MDYNSLLKLSYQECFPDNGLYTIECAEVTSTDLHWHEYYEIEYVLAGRGVEIVNGSTYPVGPGTVTLLSPVDFHAYRDIDPEHPLLIIQVSFQDLFLPKSLRNDIYMYKDAKIVDFAENALKMVFEMLNEEYHSDDYAKDTFLINGITNLCIKIMRQIFADHKTVPLDTSDRSPIQDAVLYVRTHFRENISAEAVAKTVHLSPNYFSEYFKKQTGEKFSIFVLRLRVEFAANLLRISDLSIKEVAFESGFNSAAYFSNTFKDFYGMSPEQYRKQNQKKRSQSVT